MTTIKQEVLESLTDEQVATLWTELNCHRWPEALGPQPEGYEDIIRVHPVFNQFTSYALRRIGMKAMLRYWNVEYLKMMNDIEFEEFARQQNWS